MPHHARAKEYCPGFPGERLRPLCEWIRHPACRTMVSETMCLRPTEIEVAVQGIATDVSAITEGNRGRRLRHHGGLQFVRWPLAVRQLAIPSNLQPCLTGAIILVMNSPCHQMGKSPPPPPLPLREVCCMRLEACFWSKLCSVTQQEQLLSVKSKVKIVISSSYKII